MPDNYPHGIPKFSLDTKVYSPVVSTKGEICNGLYTEKYKPTSRMVYILNIFRQCVAYPEKAMAGMDIKLSDKAKSIKIAAGVLNEEA